VTPADNDYQGGFAAGLMLKDLRLAIEAAESAGAKVELGEHARAIYEAFAKDHASTDFSGIIRTL
jgi:3-hydroxyisobutyrate dehydrogenase